MSKAKEAVEEYQDLLHHYQTLDVLHQTVKKQRDQAIQCLWLFDKEPEVQECLKSLGVWGKSVNMDRVLIFGGEHDEYQERYETWEQAEIGHKKALAFVDKTSIKSE